MYLHLSAGSMRESDGLHLQRAVHQSTDCTMRMPETTITQ